MERTPYLKLEYVDLSFACPSDELFDVGQLIVLCLRVSIYQIRNSGSSYLCLVLRVLEGKGGKWE